MNKILLIILSVIHLSLFAQLEVVDSFNIEKRNSSYLISKNQNYYITEFSKKRNKLLIFDNRTKKTIKEITLQKKTKSISSFGYSPNKKYIVIGMWDGTLLILNGKTFETLYLLKEHKNVINDICFYKSDRAATLSKDGNVITWNLKTGKQINMFNTQSNRLSHLTYNPESNVFIVRANYQKQGNSILFILNEDLSIQKKKEYNFFGNAKYIPEINTILITNSKIFTLHKIDSNGNIIGDISQHTHWIYDYASLKNGELIVSCSADNTVKIYKGNKELGSIKLSNQIITIEVLEDNLFACYTIDGKIKIIKNNY